MWLAILILLALLLGCGAGTDLCSLFPCLTDGLSGLLPGLV